MLSRASPAFVKFSQRLYHAAGPYGRYRVIQVNTTPKQHQIKKRGLSSSNTTSESGEQTIEACARDLSKISEQIVVEGKEHPDMVEMAKQLSPTARREIADLAKGMTTRTGVPEPSVRDLKLVALSQIIPFIGFGIMDNAILIIAGDAIDTSLGVALGISTMCAAAIGNIVSDVAGIALGTVIEDFSTVILKLPLPRITAAQRQLRSVRFANQLGACVGIVIGCVIGMFPLLFIDSSKTQSMKKEKYLEHIFQDVVTEAKSLIGAESTSLFILVEKDPRSDDDARNASLPIPTPDGEFLYAKYSHGDEEFKKRTAGRVFPLGKGIVSRAALSAEACNIYDVNSEPDFVPEIGGRDKDNVLSSTTQIKNMVCVPVLDSSGRAIAVVQAINKVGKGSGRHETSAKGTESGGRMSFTTADVQILKALASHISVALQYVQDQGDEDEVQVKIRDTVRILKEHGLEGIAEEREMDMKQRRRLFPED